MKIKIILFDDNKRIRESIAMLLDGSSDFELLASYPDAEFASDKLSVLKPDVILMDIDMPGTNGTNAVKEIRQSGINTPVIMLTVFDDEERIFESLRNGAVGYLLKNTPPKKLLEAVKEVYDGGAPMTPSIARKVMLYFQSQKQQAIPDYSLTDREKDVLKLLVDGLSYKLIADKLGIGFETVRTHIKKIYEKLHVQSNAEAVAKTLKEKLL